jgi:glucose-1-phosphate adenylyltransferase
VFQSLSLLREKVTDLVLILSGDHVYRMNYRELIAFHLDRGAEVTIAGIECPVGTASQFGVLAADSAGRVMRFQEKPHTPRPMQTKPHRCLVSMGVYVFGAKTLLDVLHEDAQSDTTHDFGHDIIPRVIRQGVVHVYNFSEWGSRFGSYWRDVGTVEAYYAANMELLVGPFFDPYESAGWPLCNLPPNRQRYFGESHGPIVDSIISPGVSIGRGSRVIHSVLSPGVQIQDYAEVRNSILLHNVCVGTGARVQRAIIDEDVRVHPGVELGYDSCFDREHGVITESGITVIPRNTFVERPPISLKRQMAEGPGSAESHSLSV